MMAGPLASLVAAAVAGLARLVVGPGVAARGPGANTAAAAGTAAAATAAGAAMVSMGEMCTSREDIKHPYGTSAKSIQSSYVAYFVLGRVNATALFVREASGQAFCRAGCLRMR